MVGIFSGLMALWMMNASVSFAADPAVLKPRVPADQIEEVRTWTNPLSNTADNIEKGKKIFHGKAFCVTCHGKDGTGMGNIPGLRGKLPRNFTDKAWQAKRTEWRVVLDFKKWKSGN